jgi:hypothetical protein
MGGVYVSNQTGMLHLLACLQSGFCAQAGQGHLLFSFLPYFSFWHSRVLRNFFRKKVNKKLSPAQFAMKGSAFTFFFSSANSKGEKEANISLCLGWIERNNRNSYYIEYIILLSVFFSC